MLQVGDCSSYISTVRQETREWKHKKMGKRERKETQVSRNTVCITHYSKDYCLTRGSSTCNMLILFSASVYYLMSIKMSTKILLNNKLNIKFVEKLDYTPCLSGVPLGLNYIYFFQLLVVPHSFAVGLGSVGLISKILLLLFVYLVAGSWLGLKETGVKT